ncbi:MAG: helix-hairpin-helix domain-containing protein [Oligoflexia bacterium]|nr:helix-hairpin-helix domain-containing protein [Oligoflexia bacterium]
MLELGLHSASRYYTRSTLLLVGAIALAWLCNSEKSINIDLAKVKQDSDPESLLAYGTAIPLSQATMADLLLIPGIGDTLASRIISQRAEIQAMASSLERTAAFKALEVVHGLGPKQALKLSKYIEPRQKS